MLEQSTDVVGITASGRVEDGSEVGGIDDLDDLGNKSLLGCMADLEGGTEILPNVFCRVDLWTRAAWGRDEWPRVDRSHKENIVRERAIYGVGQKKPKMSMQTTPEGGWDRTGIGF